MKPALIPRELLFGEANQILPQISPDGSHLAYIASHRGTPNLWVSGLDLSDARCLTERSERGIVMFSWSADSRYLLYPWDNRGDENWQLRAVDVGTGQDRGLTPSTPGVSARIVGSSPARPTHILVAMNKRAPLAPDVYCVEVASGQRQLILRNPGTFVEWVADGTLEVRAVLSALSGGGFELLVRAPGSRGWTKTIRWNLLDGLASGPVAFSGDGSRLYVLDSRGSETSQLVALDPYNLLTESIFQDDRADIAGVLLSPVTGEVQAVSLVRARHEWHVQDETLRPDFEALATLEAGDFYIVSRDRSDSFWIIALESDRTPTTFYLYSRETRSATAPFGHDPEFDKYTLSPMAPIAFRASDGLRIEGYLTLPPGPAGGTRPLVVKIHGGPWTRDTFGYDPEAQWLANRGYACLQVNFRGSTGYGKHFLNAGNREWGGRMQTDISDAIEWAIARGVADPGRICVFGRSYGGYAALMAAVTRPDLIRCAVDLMGPTDLCSFISHLPPNLAIYRHVFEQRVGHPERDRDFLRQRSPLFLADRIRAPVFVAHTENDPRVARENSDQLADALHRQGVECEYTIIPAEGHGLATSTSRLQLYNAVERFLSRHLGGQYERPDAV